MPTITLDIQRWQAFSHLLTDTSYQHSTELLSAFLKQLISFWPARAGSVLYVDPYAQTYTINQGTMSDEAQEMIYQACSVFKREPATDEDLGVYGIDDDSSLVELSLRSGQEQVGLLHLVVDAAKVSPENEGELALVLVGVVGGAADRVALLHTTRRRLDEMKLIYQVSQAIGSDMDLRSLLRSLVERAAELIDAEGGSLLLIDEQRQELYFEAPTSEHSQELRSYRMPIDQGFAGWVIRHGEGLIIDNPQADPRFYRRVDQDIEFTTRTIITVPVRSRDKMIGVIQLVNKREGIFDDHDMRVLSTLANQAAISIENARLYTKLKEERDRLIRKEEEVRHQINRDLHDGPTQSIAAISMNIEFIKNCAMYLPNGLKMNLIIWLLWFAKPIRIYVHCCLNSAPWVWKRRAL